VRKLFFLSSSNLRDGEKEAVNEMEVIANWLNPRANPIKEILT
jgi:hypothetical protein